MGKERGLAQSASKAVKTLNLLGKMVLSQLKEGVVAQLPESSVESIPKAILASSAAKTVETFQRLVAA